eukprot:scaffold2214_cov128-Isochrysis_galbana.AAC.1
MEPAAPVVGKVVPGTVTCGIHQPAKDRPYWGYFDCSHSRVFTPPRPVGGAGELFFEGVGGGRPDLAEGRGVGAGPAVYIFGFPSGNWFWPIGPNETGLGTAIEATRQGAAPAFDAHLRTLYHAQAYASGVLMSPPRTLMSVRDES